jgi:apolipoprotein N-acyltransferase
VFFTGFPWVASGYSQIDSPLAALAPWVGVYGIGAALAWLAAALAFSLRERRWGLAGTALALPAMLALAPLPNFTQGNGELTVALVQTNVPQDEKFSSQRLPHTLAAVRKALLEARADLVVVPETAVPLLPAQLEDFVPGYWQQLAAHFGATAQGPARAALVGAPLGNFERGYTNSIIGLSSGPSYRYDKAHLVPFGEFIPRGFRWFTEAMNIPLGDFNRGELDPPPFAAAGQRIAPNICYEDLFGEEIARRFVGAAAAPTLMANLSNIGWFGPTIAVDQHLHISRLRTLEFQVPMVRATNTGATAAITHEAVVVAMIDPNTAGTLVAKVEGRVGVTPFAAWAGRYGLAPPALLALALLAALVWRARRRRAA